ncbi:unnamed protein product [Leptidea sinapis]|uniref:NADH dehydrogenase [ubiquinone] 1 alpha subcomplex assembly factor 3 n=1 Tax=Leptidea sinapis TaxID=189913 RepID=A0A5E4R8R6_9NEOP|nr:unnamed protein product [Leptidea sinapis]
MFLLFGLGRACKFAKKSSYYFNICHLSISSKRQHKAAYEGEGKTTLRIINQEQDLGLMIDSYGAIHRTVDITTESLAIFRVLEPKIDLLIIGLETNDRRVVDPVFRATKQAGLNVELLVTEHACSTFNFLNAEGRSVAAALIPPLHIQVNEDDMLKSQLHYNNLYTKRNY